MVGCIRYLKKGQLILRSCSSSKSYNELAIVLKDQSPVETHVKVFVIGKESGTQKLTKTILALSDFGTYKRGRSMNFLTNWTIFLNFF